MREEYEPVAMVVRWVRRIVAALVLGVLVLFVARSYLLSDARVCREEAAADTGKILVCAPVGPSDLPGIAVILLASLILLLPDLSEVDIVGLVSLKRAVQEQGKQTEELTHTVQQLALSVRQETNINISAEQLGKAASDVDKKKEVLREAGFEAAAVVQPETPGSPSPAEGRSADVESATAVTAIDILRTWTTITAMLGERFPRRVERGRRPIDELDPVDQWMSLFGRELEVFQIARNTVAHRPDDLTKDQLDEAARLGKELLASLDEWLSGRRRLITH